MPILQRHSLTATFFIATGFLDGGRMWNDTIIETVRGREDLSIAERQVAIVNHINDIKYRPVADRVVVTEHLAQAAGVQLPHDLMMTSAEVKAMHKAGMQIGAHTVSHPILARLSDEQALQEIGDSKRFLEELLGERIGLFAYPNGKPKEDYIPQTVEIVRSLGFDAAVTTQWGASDMHSDMLQIRRFTPWDKSRWRFGLRLLRNLRADN
jgi:peptidoglycan/xylan/chitin deacetylase (PgdA/CDA1 family)